MNKPALKKAFLESAACVSILVVLVISIEFIFWKWAELMIHLQYRFGIWLPLTLYICFLFIVGVCLGTFFVYKKNK